MSTYVLSKKQQADIQCWIDKFPPGKQGSALLMALRIVQEDSGYLQDEHIDAVAKHLEISPMRVHEVATFYSMYHLSPRGKYVVKVCNNISCHLCKAEEIIQHIKQSLAISLGETTKDGLFSLEEAECLGACTDAPVMIVNDVDYHRKMTKASVDEVLDVYRKKSLDEGQGA